MALFLVLHVGGLLLLIVSSFATVWNRRVVVRDQPAPWKRAWSRRWQIGVLLGLLSLFSGFVHYPMTPEGGEFAMGGIPFFARSGDHGDTAVIGVVGFQLNFIFWLLLPQFALWATSGLGRRPEGGR